MTLLSNLRDKLRGTSRSEARLAPVWKSEGIEILLPNDLTEATVPALLSVVDEMGAHDSILLAYLAQLVGEDRAHLSSSRVLIPWGEVYELLESAEHASIAQSLGLPPVSNLRPVLRSDGTMTDAEFEVRVDGWADNQKEVDVSDVRGAVVRTGGKDVLFSKPVWQTIDAIKRFSERDVACRSQHENEIGWGLIRPMADNAGALYRTPYLETTYVLTPSTLRLPLRKEETPFGRVITVEPTFDGAPPGWMKAFDGFNSVQPHYDLMPRDRGHIRVVISEPVRKVLAVIKREMPGRRVAGTKAERFIHNPWAFLGETAREVLKEETFAYDQAGAGALTTSFYLRPQINSSRVERVDLVVTEHFADGTAKSTNNSLQNAGDLAKFIDDIEQAIKLERPRFPWNEFDLQVDGDSSAQLERARQILILWLNQSQTTISLEDIYELEGYSGRIEGIGVAKPIYVPLLQKPSDEEEGRPGWLPGDIVPLVKVTLAGHDGEVIIPLSKAWVEEFDRQVVEAEGAGAKIVTNATLPTPIETPQARTLVDSFRTMLAAQERIKPEGGLKPRSERAERETLLVKLNFFAVDYAEQRRLNLALPHEAQERLPRTLRPTIKLKKHQRDGISWFQHLVSRCPNDCRGALLADDMGLGKTIQLLCVLGSYYEDNPNAFPSVVIAPKSLVDNWASEVRKFFTDSYAETLILYGEKLNERKQPLALIDSQLQSRGVTDLLKPDWVGTAKVILTTYEVLTNYEFSFARQPFAFVICDEAQRIKTPGTRAALAAKALKADFRIACTGTPVENSLADLWCLFDFVQPGLLGGLEEFGRTYRRPIECDTDEQKETLRRLQDAIAPQTLRRTKLDIAGELKRKYFALQPVGTDLSFKETLGFEDRLEVAMSPYQNLLYLGGLKKLQDANDEADGRKRARLSFGALHLMRAVCAEPYCLPGMKFLPDKGGNDVHFLNAPKLRWMLGILEGIRERDEKAIVFTELREVQASLVFFLRSLFGLKVLVINGDTQNRQAYIEQFSAVKGFNVIVLSTLAAGAGLNITAANHVIHFTRAWNPSKENQATDRAYRIGQEKDVFVYCPLTVTKDYATFDVRLDDLLRRKAVLADATIGGSSMESMLNGAGREVSFTQLMGEGVAGAAEQRRYLTMDDVDRMDGFRFEVLCKIVWSKKGFLSQLTPKGRGDGGVDIIAIKGREGELLQCKSARNREIGWDAIKEVAAGAARYQSRYATTSFRRVAVTNQLFNGVARAQAEANRVLLVERPQMEESLSRMPISNLEFEDELAQVMSSNIE